MLKLYGPIATTAALENGPNGAGQQRKKKIECRAIKHEIVIN